MIRAPEQLAAGKILCWTAAITTLVVTPWASYDPINLPKLAIVSVGGFVSIFLVIASWESIIDKKYRFPLIAVLLFVIDLTLVLVFAGTNFNQEFFGANGRATGYLAYLALAGLLLAGVISGVQEILKRVSWFLIYAGLFSILYGLLQANNSDPVKWVNSNSPVIGFLGNPDFQSSFIGLSAVMALALVFNKELKKFLRFMLVALIISAFFVIYETKAQQGFFVLIGGCAVVIFIFIYKSGAKLLTLVYFFCSIVALTLAGLGSLNRGPLASILFKDSVTYRGDYWQAGWNMTLTHPIFGVGLDSYGDWYRRARTVVATWRRGPDLTSNSAHNVLLDFSSNGGFPLLIIYLALMILVFSAAYKVIRRSNTFEPVFTGLFATWIAYQAQSIISLNQLGIAVWGWVISGLIIGYEINGRIGPQPRRALKNSRNASLLDQDKVRPETTLMIFVGFLIGLVIGLPPLIASANFKSALESGDMRRIIEMVDTYPQDSWRSAQIGYILYQNKSEQESLRVTSISVQRYPDLYSAWRLLVSLDGATPKQVLQAKAQMKRLDPHNPDLK